METTYQTWTTSLTAKKILESQSTVKPFATLLVLQDFLL